MAKMDAAFIKERAEQLTIVYLTRRDDVRVIRNSMPGGPALLVSLLHQGQDVGRYLGVEVSGTVSERGLKRTEQTIEVSPSVLNALTFRDTPYPICLFYFTMQDDAGYWNWMKAPNNRGGLSSAPAPTLGKLTDQELNSIWAAVERWYQQREQLVAA
ncbi:MAG: DUF4365 domain-containing protein [Armatimonadota bacterium]|nr:DUF4365 domain-containing protein [Armatimonadota bacterium]